MSNITENLVCLAPNISPTELDQQCYSILEKIERHGYFEFHPNYWTILNDGLNKLLLEKIIISLEDLGMKDCLNASYIYTYVDNRFNVYYIANYCFGGKSQYYIFSDKHLD